MTVVDLPVQLNTNSKSCMWTRVSGMLGGLLSVLNVISDEAEDSTIDSVNDICCINELETESARR